MRVGTMTAVILVSAFVSLGVGFGPAYLAAADTAAAAAREDEAALRRNVDFVALEEDLRADFRAALDRRFGGRGLEGPMAAIAGAVLAPFSDAAAAALASPQGLIAAAREAEIEDRGLGTLGYALANGRFTGVSRFALDLGEGRDGEPPARLVFAREGLRWRAVALDLPPSALGEQG